MHDTARITLVQLHQDHDTVIERMRPCFEEAAAFGSDMIVFPEYTLGQRIPISHERVAAFRELAARYGLYAIAGLVESHGTRWATTALMVDRQGDLLGRYYKTHPAAGPPPHWWPPIAGQDAEARGILGNQFKVFHLDFAPVGILQCYDGYFPEAWGCTSYAGGMVEDYFCQMAAHAYGCVVGANISDGCNTGFAAPPGDNIVIAEGQAEPARLFPRRAEEGDGCVHAVINLARLRWVRKHLRTMHQRRPELYHRLVEDVKLWQDYPDIPWDYDEAWDLLNKAQL